MNAVTRREAIRALAMGLVAAPAALRGRSRLFAQANAQYSARPVRPVEASVVVDLDVVGNPNAVNGGGFDPRTQPNFSRYRYPEDPGGAINIRGLNHSKRVFDLTEGLVRRGYTDARIAMVLGANAMRVLGTIWAATP